VELPIARTIIRVAKETADEVDALAAAMGRSRDWVINQAIEQYLETNAWQVERIKAGMQEAREGRVISAEDVYAAIATKHGWTR
jgi:predicted transcriptional regulator